MRPSSERSNTRGVRLRTTWGALAVAAAIAASGVVIASQSAPVETVRALYAAATEAYNKKDYPEYLRNMEAVIAQRPVHPTLLRRLAAAYALKSASPSAS